MEKQREISSLIRPCFTSCRRPNDCQYLHHYIRGHFRHSRSRWHRGVDFKPTEEVLNPAEQINENALAGVDVLSRLKSLRVKMGCTTK